MSEAESVELELHDGYRFEVRFSRLDAAWTTDEAPPLGEGSGPSPVHLLLAAVANCMSASLLFALGKFRNDPRGMRASARAQVGRNEAGRQRVLAIAIEIRIGAVAAELQHLDRILPQFEEFCTVGQSVRAGVPVELAVYDGSGACLHGPSRGKT